MNEPKPAGAGGKQALKGYQWKPWKIASVGVAALFLVTGGVLAVVGGSEEGGKARVEAGPVGGPSGNGGTVKGLGGTSAAPTVRGEFGVGYDQETSGAETWSPAMLRGGISFFVAFCLAFALRAFIRIGAIFIGVWALSLFVMSYIGWVEVNWQTIDDQFVGWTRSLGDQFSSFQHFITGSLPSATLAGLGLVAGFKKK